MQNEQTMQEEEKFPELTHIQEAIKIIYAGQSQRISYAQTYQAVFKLCKKGMHENLINKICQISKEHYSFVLGSINLSSEKDENLFQNFKDVVEKCKDAIDRLVEIFLYVQTNYFYQCKRQYNSIKQMLISLLYQELIQNRKILNMISQIITKIHKEGLIQSIQNFLTIIEELDTKQSFLEDFFIPIYQPILKQHFKKLSSSKIAQIPQKQYFLWGKETLQNQRQFLLKYLKRNNSKKPIQKMMKQFYQVIVTVHKSKIYQANPELLFKKNALLFLQLLAEKGEEQEIQEYTDWFVDQMKKKVSEFDKNDNKKFLQSIVGFYDQIGTYFLVGTSKFNIKYKAVFFYQQWINDQKISLPKRMNYYIEQTIKSNEEGDKTFLDTFQALFKLLKEKDLFEREFRQSVVVRQIYEDLNPKLQEKLVDIMVTDCGKEWAQKIISLKESINAQQSTQIFRPFTFEDVAWPFQKKKQVATLPPQLCKFTQEFVLKFQEENKTKLLTWDCFFGSVLFTITFNNTVQKFKADTCMITILLYLQSLKFNTKIIQIMKKSNYTFEELKAPLKTLANHKILTIGALQKTTQEIQLNKQFSSENTLIDLTLQNREKKLRCNEQEELKADRKLMIEALIIKLMKSAKVIRMDEMYEKITPMIESRGFNFNQTFVDNTFNGLINKNYIRNHNDGSFTYIAS